MIRRSLLPLHRPQTCVGCPDRLIHARALTIRSHVPVASMSGAAPEPNAASVRGDGKDVIDAAKPSALQRLKRFFIGDKLDKQRLAELGMGAFAAYGVISNLNACVLMTIAWMTVVGQTGMTPFAPGNWAKFIGIYAGLWITTNFLRPIRLSLALAAAASFDRAIGFIQSKTNAKKPVAFGLLLACIACCTMSSLILVLFLLGGFPNGIQLPFLK